MKKLLLIFLCFPFLGYAQKTYIPDDAFEQALINLDLDDVLDDSIYTSAVDTVLTLYLSNNGITDLTGITDFIQLTDLLCNGNQIIDLDLSSNSNLVELNCNNNLLASLDVRNGNNSGLWYFTAVNNPQLYCIAVNDIAYANYNWVKDSGCVFSTNCGTSSVEDYQSKRKLIKVLDVFGRSITPKPNMLLINIYDDGSVEKRIVLD
jgi:Leucine-rich repeat (LRR) protein